MNRATIAALVLGILGLFGVGLAIAAYDGESTETAKASFCDSLTDLSSTVMSYEGLNPVTATTDELDAAADDIEEAWDDVVDDGYDWVYAEDNTLTEAYDDLYYAIEGLDGDLTVSQSIAALDEELSAFPQAYAETFDGSGCSTV